MYSGNVPIYQIQQIRELERLAKEKPGLSGSTMMQRAGKAAFDFLLRRFPNAQKMAVFCGGGNNGGDGHVLAQLAHEHGMNVTIWHIGNPDVGQGEARDAYHACCEAKVPHFPFHEKADLAYPDVMVDAICGIGTKDNLREEVVAAIKKMHAANAPVLAIDVPSGIDADTGQVLGAAVRATATITFIGLKLGLLTGNGPDYTGELVLNDLQLPVELFSSVAPVAEKIQLHSYASYLKPRLRDWNKGLSGHVLVVGGGPGFSGAPRLAAMAALRVGAGLVTIATHPEHAAMMNANCPELMCQGVSGPEELAPLAAKATVIVVGPGMTQTSWAKKLWQWVASQSLPLVIDADGLNLLAQENAAFLRKIHDNWVLTPHPAEAARLLKTTTSVVQENRLSAIHSLHQRYGATAILKGAGSLVLGGNSLPALCDKGNPGMATAGTGDILSGVIAGLIAQGIPLSDAAKLGVHLHAMAGDLAAKDGERGMIATDMLPSIRRLANYSIDIKQAPGDA